MCPDKGRMDVEELRAQVVADIPGPQLESKPRAQQCLHCGTRLLWGQMTWPCSLLQQEAPAP